MSDHSVTLKVSREYWRDVFKEMWVWIVVGWVLCALAVGISSGVVAKNHAESMRVETMFNDHADFWRQVTGKEPYRLSVVGAFAREISTDMTIPGKIESLNVPSGEYPFVAWATRYPFFGVADPSYQIDDPNYYNESGAFDAAFLQDINRVRSGDPGQIAALTASVPITPWHNPVFWPGLWGWLFIGLWAVPGMAYFIAGPYNRKKNDWTPQWKDIPWVKDKALTVISCPPLWPMAIVYLPNLPESLWSQMYGRIRDARRQSVQLRESRKTNPVAAQTEQAKQLIDEIARMQNHDLPEVAFAREFARKTLEALQAVPLNLRDDQERVRAMAMLKELMTLATTAQQHEEARQQLMAEYHEGDMNDVIARAKELTAGDD